MRKICILLPFPPPFYGPSVYSNYFLEAVRDIKNIDFIVIDAELNQETSEIGNGSLFKIFKFLKTVIKVLLSGFNNIVFINLHISFSGSFKACFTILISKLINSKIIIILHEGGLTETYNSVNFFHKFFINTSVKLSKIIITLDTIQYEEWKKIFPSKNFEILPAFRETSKIYEKKNDFIFFSNLIPEKGVFEVIKIWEEFTKRFGNNFNLTIMGSTMDKKTIDLIFQKIEKFNNVYLEVNPHREEALYQLRSSKVFMMPTYYFLEQQPAVIIEAMSYGLPIIGSKWRGLPFLIEENFNGFTIDNNDIDNYVNKMKQIISDEKTYKKFSNNAYSQFLKNHSREVYINKLKTIINSID